MAKSFRKFLEEKGAHPFIQSLEDVLGINPEDISGETSAFFKMGEKGFGTNLGTYKIVDYKKNDEGKITHAVLKIVGIDKKYKDDDGKFSQIPGSKDSGREIIVPIEDLDELMQQNFKTAQA